MVESRLNLPANVAFLGLETGQCKDASKRPRAWMKGVRSLRVCGMVYVSSQTLLINVESLAVAWSSSLRTATAAMFSKRL